MTKAQHVEPLKRFTGFCLVFLWVQWAMVMGCNGFVKLFFCQGNNVQQASLIESKNFGEKFGAQVLIYLVFFWNHQRPSYHAGSKIFIQHITSIFLPRSMFHLQMLYIAKNELIAKILFGFLSQHLFKAWRNPTLTIPQPALIYLGLLLYWKQ